MSATISKQFTLEADTKTMYTFHAPEASGWKCYCFGMNGSLVIMPPKGCVPNWFWRKMQYLILGNKWVKND